MNRILRRYLSDNIIGELEGLLNLQLFGGIQIKNRAEVGFVVYVLEIDEMNMHFFKEKFWLGTVKVLILLTRV